VRRTRSCADESPQNLQEPIIVNLRTSFRGAALAVGGLLVMAGVVLANGGSADDRTGASTSPSANPTPGGAVFATLTPEPSPSAEPSESPEATESPEASPDDALEPSESPEASPGATPEDNADADNSGPGNAREDNSGPGNADDDEADEADDDDNSGPGNADDDVDDDDSSGHGGGDDDSSGSGSGH
jgi:hypothetical protein